MSSSHVSIVYGTPSSRSSSPGSLRGGQDDDLEQLPIQKLRKMAKDLGLPADGSKTVLAGKIRNASKIRQNQEESDDLEEEGDETDTSDKEAPPILQAADLCTR